MDYPHKGPVMLEAFPCHDIITIDLSIYKWSLSWITNVPKESTIIMEYSSMNILEIWFHRDKNCQQPLNKYHSLNEIQTIIYLFIAKSVETFHPSVADSFYYIKLFNILKTEWPTFSRLHFKFIFLNENIWISVNISLKFVPERPINNFPVLVQMMT